MLCYPSDGNVTNFMYCFFNFLVVIAEVDGLASVQFSMNLRSLQNALCHINNCVRNKVDTPKFVCNIFNNAVAVIPLEIKIFKQTRQTNFSHHKQTIAKHTLIDTWRSNFT